MQLAQLSPAFLAVVSAARKWATDALQLHVPGATPSIPSSSNSAAAAAVPTAGQVFSLSRETAAARPPLTAQTINDRYTQHTQHCVICQKALKELQFKLKVAQIAAAALAAGFIGLMSAVVLPGVVSKVVAVVTGASAAAGATAGAVAWGPVAAAAAVLGAGAALAAAVASSTAKLVEQFLYVEFSHAHND
jgi:hypothetical protein